MKLAIVALLPCCEDHSQGDLWPFAQYNVIVPNGPRSLHSTPAPPCAYTDLGEWINLITGNNHRWEHQPRLMGRLKDSVGECFGSIKGCRVLSDGFVLSLLLARGLPPRAVTVALLAEASRRRGGSPVADVIWGPLGHALRADELWAAAERPGVWSGGVGQSLLFMSGGRGPGTEVPRGSR